MSHIQYPYIPEGRAHVYVGIDNRWMAFARQTAKERSLDKGMPNSSVIVRNNVVLGYGANGSDHHEKHGCERKRLGCKTGEGYELCEGCSPKNHGEPKAIANALTKHADLSGADVYLWGHWWCCKPCWDSMVAAGIRDVYLLQGSEVLFNSAHPENIIGRQFTYDR